MTANEVSGKKYPLAGRCLHSRDAKLVNQLESVLLSGHESMMVMQIGTGVDPATVFLLALGCRNINCSSKLQLVSGEEGKEEWKEVHEAVLDSMFRKYRTIFAEQLQKRFQFNGHPGKPVLLCLKMNAIVDTSKHSPLFKDKSSVFELMEGEYMRALRPRPHTVLTLAPRVWEGP